MTQPHSEMESSFWLDILVEDFHYLSICANSKKNSENVLSHKYFESPSISTRNGFNFKKVFAVKTNAVILIEFPK